MSETEKRNKAVRELLNGTAQAIEAVIPIDHDISKPTIYNDKLMITFGVLIGITGDLKGKLVISGEIDVFAAVGEAMYGMSLEGEMLESFSGELGNMLAGQLTTNISNQGINTDITSPTIMAGNTRLSGYKQALRVTVTFADKGDMDIYLLID